MQRMFRLAVLAAAIPIGVPIRAQSADAICGDTAVSARILSTGPVRTIITRIQDLRVCVAAEGFTDSLPLHPRDWSTSSRLVVRETRGPGDLRRMQSSSVLTSWTKNGRTLPNDTSAAAWRAAVDELIAAQWDYAVQRIGRMELEDEITGVVAQQQWMLAQIDTIRRKADSLRVQISQSQSSGQMEYGQRIARALQAEAVARSRLSQARSHLASIPRTDGERIARAMEAVGVAEERVRQAAEVSQRVRAGAGGGDQTAQKQLLLDNLDPAGRIETLKSMLLELDAETRLANLRAALKAFDSQPDLEPRLRDAAARIKAILER